MTKPEDAMPVVAWFDPANCDPGQSATFMRSRHQKWPYKYPVALVRQSDALSAITLVQQERDELRAALEKLAEWPCPHMDESRAFCMRKAARAALTPKATQPEKQA